MLLSLFMACGIGRNEVENQDGDDGTDGLTALISTEESSDSNCENGGVLISYGLDLNANQILEKNEVTGNESICHGLDGGNGIDGQNVNAAYRWVDANGG